MELHTKLVYLRKRNGLTQLDLAERLSLSRQAISRWESGMAMPSTDNLIIISQLYGVSLDYLLNDDADDLYEIEEGPEQRPNGQTKITGNNKRFFLGVLILIIMIAIFISFEITQNREQNHEQITLIEEMDVLTEDNYSSVTFQLE